LQFQQYHPGRLKEIAGFSCLICFFFFPAFYFPFQIIASTEFSATLIPLIKDSTLSGTFNFGLSLSHFVR